MHTCDFIGDLCIPVYTCTHTYIYACSFRFSIFCNKDILLLLFKMFLVSDVPRSDREEGNGLCRTMKRSSSARKYMEPGRIIISRSRGFISHETSGSTSTINFSTLLCDTKDDWSITYCPTLGSLNAMTQGCSTQVDNDTGIISAHQAAYSNESICMGVEDHCTKGVVEPNKIGTKCFRWESRQNNSVAQKTNGPCINKGRPLKAFRFDSKTSVVRSTSAERMKTTRLVLNVGGVIFETLETTLAVHPNTLLGDPERRNKYLNHYTGEFVFHRRFACFDAILFFYQSKGILAKPQTVDQVTFDRELEFFEIPIKKSKCISRNHSNWVRPKRSWTRGETMVRVLRRLFHRPFSSPLSSVIAVFNIVFTILLVVEFCISTIPKYRRLSHVDPLTVLHRGGHFKGLAAIEILCMMFLTVDFLIRFLLSQHRFKFLTSHLSIIDVVTMFLFHSSLLLSNLNIGIGQTSYLYLLRQIRILQVFRLARYSYGFRSLLQTISKSLVHLGSFILIAPVMSMCFASIMFFFEEEDYIQNAHCSNKCRPFGSLSDWFWYSIITLTTVGYGDVYPRTVFGKMTGTVCALFGVILFCLLTPIIFRQFVEQYYIPRLSSRTVNAKGRKLAEKVKEMYYDDRSECNS